MVINKHNNIISPSILLCEDCQRKVAAFKGSICKQICGCEGCGFDLSFEDIDNIYEGNALAAVELTKVSLNKGNIIALIDEGVFKIVLNTNMDFIGKLEKKLGNLAAFGVFVSEKNDAHKSLNGLIKAQNGCDLFLNGEDNCIWSVHSPATQLNVSTPRTVLEMILIRELGANLFILDGKKKYSDEWEVKQNLKKIVDYFLIRSERKASIGE